MFYLTFLSNKMLDAVSFGQSKDFYVIPIEESASSILQDVLFTQWPQDVSTALILEINESDVLPFSYYLYNSEGMYQPHPDHYRGYLCTDTRSLKRIAEFPITGKLCTALESNIFRYFLSEATGMGDFLLYRVQETTRLDTYVVRRLEMLRDNVFVSQTQTAESVSYLLDMIEKFCILKGPDRVCLDWCKSNAPAALRFCKDSEIVELMHESWLDYVKQNYCT